MKPDNSASRLLTVFLGATIIYTGATTSLASPGYTTDSAGRVVTSGFGECVKTDAWTPDLNTPECDPALAARLEEENARRAAEIAALERHAPPVTLLQISDKRNVMFEFNSAKLTPAATQDLDRALSKVGEFNAIDAIDIVGHTDSIGPESYNQSLSEKRAESVRQFLELRGIDAELLSASGEGETSPVADNNSREGRARNRRVDILVHGNVVE